MSAQRLRLPGGTYTFVRDETGHDIYLDGEWVGWSAGTLQDAKDTARDIERNRR